MRTSLAGIPPIAGDAATPVPTEERDSGAPSLCLQPEIHPKLTALLHRLQWLRGLSVQHSCANRSNLASHLALLRRTLVRRTAIQRIQRFFAIIGFTAFVGIVLIAARLANMEISWEPTTNTPNIELPIFNDPPVLNDQIALISGHAGNDSGAICTDAEGNTTLTEAEVNADIANRAADLLRREEKDVLILEEYDPRLVNLQVDALLSIHADSCIQASGYKAAYYAYSAIPDIEVQLLNCIDTQYPAITGLTQHANTVTHDMTEYHAFRKVAPNTPAAILELGFLGGDQELLVNQSDRAARGVVESILCFLNSSEPNPTKPDSTSQLN